jgi:hypothetical protein
MNEFKRRVRQFEKENGTECYLADDGMLYYKTGAFREPSPLGVMAPALTPTTNETEYLLAQHILRFYQLRLDARIRAFEECKEKLENYEVENKEERLGELRQLQKRVAEAKPDLNRAEDALNRTAWGRSLISRREAEEERQNEFKQWRSRVRRVRI